MLSKFKEKILDQVVVPTPFVIIDNPKYKRLYKAEIIKMDHDRVSVIDWLLANLFKTLLLVKDRFWQEAFITVYANYTVIENFNEFICCSKYTLLLVILL